jgi:hypothetical protein
VLWALPLGAWFTRRGESVVCRWALMSSAAAPLLLPARPPLRPSRAAAIGAGAGLVAFLGVVVLTAADAATFWPLSATPILAQAGASVAAARVASRARTAHGLLAAFTAGAVAELLWVGLALTVYGPAVAGPVFLLVQPLGVLTAGGLAAILALLAARVVGFVGRSTVS